MVTAINAYDDKFVIVKNGRFLVNLKDTYSNDFFVLPNFDHKVMMVGKNIVIIGLWSDDDRKYKNVYCYDVDKEELYKVAEDCMDAKVNGQELGVKTSKGWEWYNLDD